MKLDAQKLFCEILNMFSQTTITQFRQMRAANIERDMGGVTTGELAALRAFLLVVVSWGSLGIGFAALIGVLKLAGASADAALVSFFAYMLLWLGFSFTQLHSRFIEWIIAFFEGGILPQGIGCFGQPSSSEIFQLYSQYLGPVLGVPTTPPRRIA